MKRFNEWLATTPLGSAFKIFIALFGGAMIATWAGSGEISFDQWQAWFIGAIAVAAVPVWNWLNPRDARYGRGSSDTAQ